VAKKSMADAVGEVRERLGEPANDPKAAGSLLKLTDFSPTAGRYVKQRRVTLSIKVGHDVVFKETLSGFHVMQHRDQYATEDAENRKLRVESDETTYVIIATKHDMQNALGRRMRKRKAEPIVSLEEMLSKLACLGSTAEGEEDDGEVPGGEPSSDQE